MREDTKSQMRIFDNWDKSIVQTGSQRNTHFEIFSGQFLNGNQTEKCLSRMNLEEKASRKNLTEKWLFLQKPSRQKANHVKNCQKNSCSVGICQKLF